MVDKQTTGVQVPEEAVTIFKALSDPNRLKILDVLMQGVSCNCELNDLLGLPPNLLSHHLRVLRRAGLVTSRRDIIDGRWIYYEVDKETVARCRAWFTGFFDLSRLQPRSVCGPEGQQQGIQAHPAVCSTAVPER